MNKTNTVIMRQKEQMNAVLDQNKEHKVTQRQALEVTVFQTQKLQTLEAKLKQQIANIITSSGSSTPGQVPETIDTNSSGSYSTTSTVTKEEMMQMSAKFTQNLQQ